MMVLEYLIIFLRQYQITMKQIYIHVSTHDIFIPNCVLKGQQLHQKYVQLQILKIHAIVKV